MKGQLREFVVGTGGSASCPFASQPAAGSAKPITQTPGILALTLTARGAYSWTFLNAAGAALDQGVG